jgi:hypothetical protein
MCMKKLEHRHAKAVEQNLNQYRVKDGGDR